MASDRDIPSGPDQGETPHGSLSVLLRGGARDGQVTRITAGLTRLLAVSDAPGLLDVYELTEEQADQDSAPGAGDGPLPVFALVSREPAEGITPELQHMPTDNPVPGST